MASLTNENAVLPSRSQTAEPPPQAVMLPPPASAVPSPPTAASAATPPAELAEVPPQKRQRPLGEIAPLPRASSPEATTSVDEDSHYSATSVEDCPACQGKHRAHTCVRRPKVSVRGGGRKPCRCGSTTHRRVNNRACPLNEKYQNVSILFYFLSEFFTMIFLIKLINKMLRIQSLISFMRLLLFVFNRVAAFTPQKLRKERRRG